MLAHHENRRTFALTSTVLGCGLLLGALAHTLGPVPLGALENEPPMLPSAVVELVCGVLTLVAAFMLRAHRPDAWKHALGAHVIALVSLLVGMFSLALGVGFSTPLNTIYHVIMLALLAFNTVGLWRTRPRNPLKRAQHEMAARLY